MAMTLTRDQKCLLRILQPFGALRRDQADKLMRLYYPEIVLERTLHPLLMNRTVIQHNGYLFLPGKTIDRHRIMAADILLLIGFDQEQPILAGEEPMILTFFKWREKSLWRYDICPVAYGTERVVSAQLEGMASDRRMWIFLPDREEQMQGITLSCAHCYVVQTEIGYEFHLCNEEVQKIGL